MTLKPAIYINILVCSFLLLYQNLSAQTPGFSISCRDSIKQDASSSFIYNFIHCNNTSSQELHITLDAIAPQGWRILSFGEKGNEINIKPGEDKILPLTVIKLPNAIAEWSPVKIYANKTGSKDTITRQFYIMANIVSQFKITPLTTVINLRDKQKDFTISFKILNYGSVKGNYKITYKSKQIGINLKSAILLGPGKDTTIFFQVKIPDKVFANFSQDKINVAISDNSELTSSFQVDIVRLQPSLKQHESPYVTLPLELETGMLRLNNIASYFANARGSFKIKNDKISFYYNSKQFGSSNRLEKNLFGLNFSNRHWDIYAGQLSDSKFFFTNGTGLKVIYRNNSKIEVGLSGILHNDYYLINNDNFTGSVKYEVNKKVITQALSVNLDSKTRYHSYLFMNSMDIIKTKTMNLKIGVGAGIDQSTLVIADSLKNKVGTALDYSFLYNKNKIQFSSSIQQNSINFPGINKGSKIQSHNIHIGFSNKFVELFYQYSHYSQNLLRDTLYNADILDYNISRYGIRLGIGTKIQTISISTGKLKQNFQSGSDIPSYQFGELYYKLAYHDYSFLLNTTGGYSGTYGVKNQKVLLLNSNITLNFKYGGIKSFYLQTPYFDQLITKELLGYTKSLLVSPYVNLTMFKRLKTNLSYSISKSLYDNSIKTYAGFSLHYTNSKKGIRFSLNGSVPMVATSGSSPTSKITNRLSNQLISLSMHKKFNIPLFFAKKYYDLLVVPYNDANNNGRRDKGEQTLRNVEIFINKLPFISDEKGVIAYKNIDTGIYKIKIDQLHELQGMIPLSGKVQMIDVTANSTIDIPFKKSKVVKGTVKLLLDSLSHTVFTPDNLKITATDTTGMVFTTITNEKGDYFINLLSGIYIVSLNPEAFNENLKPRELSFTVDLSEKEEQVINFSVIEKKRKVRFLKN